MNNSSFDLSSEDETEIRRLVQRMMDGWNALDAQEFAAPFTEDADYVIIWKIAAFQNTRVAAS